MTDSKNFNNNRAVIDGVQNAVIPYACPVPFFALQLFDSRHIGVITKGPEAGDNFLKDYPVFSLDFLQFFRCFARQFDPVRGV